MRNGQLWLARALSACFQVIMIRKKLRFGYVIFCSRLYLLYDVFKNNTAEKNIRKGERERENLILPKTIGSIVSLMNDPGLSVLRQEEAYILYKRIPNIKKKILSRTEFKGILCLVSFLFPTIVSDQTWILTHRRFFQEILKPYNQYIQYVYFLSNLQFSYLVVIKVFRPIPCTWEEAPLSLYKGGPSVAGTGIIHAVNGHHGGCWRARERERLDGSAAAGQLWASNEEIAPIRRRSICGAVLLADMEVDVD